MEITSTAEKARSDSGASIVVLDAGTIKLPDDAWNPLRALGSLTLHESTPHDDRDLIAERISTATVVLTNKVPLRAPTLANCPHLALISTLATGFNCVDGETARKKGITLCNVPGYSTPAVAQHTIALILELTNRVGLHSEAVHRGAWGRSPFFYFQERPVVELVGRTVGFLGYGEIARNTAKLVQAFGAKVLAFRRRPDPTAETPDFRWAGSVEQIFAESDLLSLHCPLTSETEGIVNAGRLALMKRGSFLINTARGQLIDEKALIEALRSGHLAGAALDVVSQEPLPADSPLLENVPNLIITPHNGWSSRESQEKLLDQTVRNISAFLAGQPVHVVN